MIHRLLAISLLFSTPIWCQIQFSDMTESAGFESVRYNTFGVGVALSDFDLDGDIDLFLPTDAYSPNHLFVNQGEGEFIDMASALGLSESIRSRAAMWLDFDGDKLPDLLVLGDCLGERKECSDSSLIRLYRQTDNGFIDVTTSSGLIRGLRLNTNQLIGGLAVGDIQNDGYPDIIFSVYNGHPHLMVNEEGEYFREKRIWERQERYFQPLFYDFNHDGYQDIFITVDGAPNEVWINQGNGRFQESGALYGLNTNQSDMGIAPGDFDNDGDMDFYVTNVMDRMRGNYNFLFKSEGDSLFTDQADAYGVGEGGWGWGAAFFDADNDGWLDLAETNGFSSQYRYTSKFWKYDGQGFHDISDLMGFGETYDGNSLVAADMDDDGDLDMIETLRWKDESQRGLNYWQNRSDGGNYLIVRPRMNGLNHLALGAVVEVQAGDLTMQRYLHAGSSFLGQEPAEAAFGLGMHQEADVRITWPGGQQSEWQAFAANQKITLYDSAVLYPPLNLRLTGSSETELELTWNYPSFNHDGFIMERTTDLKEGEWVEMQVDPDSLTFTDHYLTPYTSYFYRIRATKGNKYSAYTPVAEGFTQEYIAAPNELFATTSSPFNVMLSWQINSANHDHFVVERSMDAQFEAPVILHTTDSIIYDNDIEPDGQYYYRVKAENSSSYSAYSEVAEVRIPDYIAPPDNLTYYFTSESEVLLSWEDNSDNESGFMIERSLTADFTYAQQFYTGANRTSFRDRDVFDGLEVYYRIRGFNENTTSAFTRATRLMLSSTSDKTLYNIYPNPVTGNTLNIRLPYTVHNKVMLEIYNNLGRLHSRHEYEPTVHGTITMKFDAPPGQYFLHLRAGKINSCFMITKL